MRKYDCIYLAIIAVTAYVITTIFVFTQCVNQQHSQPTGSDSEIAAALRSFPLSSAQLCDKTKLEEYFKVRFLEEVQNLVNGNETEFVTKMKMAQKQMVTNEIETTLRATKEEFQSKLSSLQASNQQQILDMKKRYEEHGKNNVLLPKDRVGNYFANMARVSRDSFNQTFSAQFGYEFLESYSGSQDLLLLYTSDEATAINFSSYRDNGSDGDGDGGTNMIPFIEDAAVATENCDELRVVFISLGRPEMRQCLALVPNLESFHVHPLVRPSRYENPPSRDKLIIHRTQPFQFKSRYYRMQIPTDDLRPPPRFEQETRVFLKYLQNYLLAVDTVLEELRTILSKIAINNQVIVMFCNYGQAVLLNNFICTAQARNINLSNLIVFTTDQETTDMVASYGLTAYYDQGRFGEHSRTAAVRFGDAVFRDMAMGKIRAAQLVSVLGYDFLFQDVDIVWFKHPLAYFRNHSNNDFDMYFQKDGLVSKYNTPLGVNTGCYYVRNNELTQHFFTSLLLNGDTMFRSHNDQEDIGVRLADFSSVYGLKVKVIPRAEVATPGGYQFHDMSPFGKDYMRKILNNTHIPYLFHMSWTDGKEHKIQYLQQMGQWYVNEGCIDKSFDEIVAGSQMSKKTIPAHCCSLAPIIRCHYRDKPSIVPCSEYNPIEKGAPSWW